MTTVCYAPTRQQLAQFRPATLPTGLATCPGCKHAVPEHELLVTNWRRCKACRTTYHRERLENCPPCLEAARARKREWQRTEAGRISARKAVAKYNSADPTRERARRIFKAALRRGEVTVAKVCALECTGECFGRLEHHHLDYARPLDVRTLCKIHHERTHKLGTVAGCDGTPITAPPTPSALKKSQIEKA
jgi:hypothetical protein